jgi:hypothetical protein
VQKDSVRGKCRNEQPHWKIIEEARRHFTSLVQQRNLSMLFFGSDTNSQQHTQLSNLVKTRRTEHLFTGEILGNPLFSAKAVRYLRGLVHDQKSHRT